MKLYKVFIYIYKVYATGSYTSYLFKEGLDKILKKVGEESSEVIISSKNSNKEEKVYEISDLLYHLLVLMVHQGVAIDDIAQELEKRRQKTLNKKVMGKRADGID
ncbi:phosphoribosyl-ATP diphosphatase [Clostridium sp. JN-1]|uniref:phosphoribosyl-ATP diphosphatase n=1 Tax=Clostridium sp. JN-1 TaxID=2483110 RepID=UPI000F0BA06E|nr:phosphoribosyl-ATP diphosphatase [Clostridium sp. JN-1]